MTLSHRWEQWEGSGYPSEKYNPIIYFYPGTIDIEVTENRDDLAIEIHRDGIVPAKRDAHTLLETAIVVHGQVERSHGELAFYTGGGILESLATNVHNGTWVELDEYVD